MKLVRELLIFGVKQAYACVFAGTLLLAIAITHFWYPLESLYRYDFLLIFAVAVQLALLATRLESLREAAVILAFHLVAMAMEVFKTSDSIQSWRYPENFEIGIGNVPLFAGFMYSAVGSYIARIWRIFDFRFSRYPRPGLAAVLALLIYLNFFAHHYIWDSRWVLIGLVVLLFGRTRIHFRVDSEYRSMPLLLGWALVALFIWFAENGATYGKVWLYPNQYDGWDMVSLGKLSSWFLLMILSFVLVSFVHRPKGEAASQAGLPLKLQPEAQV